MLKIHIHCQEKQCSGNFLIDNNVFIKVAKGKLIVTAVYNN